MTPHPSADKRLPPSPSGEGYRSACRNEENEPQVRLGDCVRYTFAFSGCRGRHPLPRSFIIFRRGDSRIARLCLRYAFVFYGRRNASPTRNLITLHSALCILHSSLPPLPYKNNILSRRGGVSPPVSHTIIVCFRDAEDVIPYGEY